MNWLQIVQMACRESRVIPVEPTTVSSQTGKTAKIISGINDEYRDLQIEQDWDWMHREFTKALSIGNRRYTAVGLAITDFSRWEHDRQPAHPGDNPYYPYSIYDAALGVSDESSLEEITYQEWRVTFDRGNQVQNRPTKYAISPIGEFCVGPIPDKAYVFRGECFGAIDVLTGDSSTPLLPDLYHQYLAWRAIARLREGDEANPQVIAAAVNNAARIKGTIIRNQTEAYVVGGGPIA